MLDEFARSDMALKKILRPALIRAGIRVRLSVGTLRDFSPPTRSSTARIEIPVNLRFERLSGGDDGGSEPRSLPWQKAKWNVTR